jgi:hypothetical protein
MPTLVRHWLSWKWFMEVHRVDRVAAGIGCALLLLGAISLL